MQRVAILRELQPLTGVGRYVFPSLRTPARPMSENTVNAALRRLGYDGDQMTGHGFRSMASTLLNEQGGKRDAIERQLAHGERDEVRAAYNYAQDLPERRRMMQSWADTADDFWSWRLASAHSLGRAPEGGQSQPVRIRSIWPPKSVSQPNWRRIICTFAH